MQQKSDMAPWSDSNTVIGNVFPSLNRRHALVLGSEEETSKRYVKLDDKDR
jgi:hypothetical protein